MKRKQILLTLLALLVAALAVNVNAEIVASGDCGDNLTWTLDDAGILTISGTGPMDDWGGAFPEGGGASWTSAPWDKFCSDVETIIINNGVTTIGFAAFDDFTNLTNITIPDSITSIGGIAFARCVHLTSLSIPSSVSNIGYGTFEYCNNLNNVIIGNSVTNIGECAFFGCDSLTSVTIPDSTTSIGNSAFSGCSGLTDVTIGDSVTSIGDSTFKKCVKLTDITIPNSVTSIGEGVLSGCSNLESVTIPFVGDSRKTHRSTYQYPFGYIFGCDSYFNATETVQNYYGASTSSFTEEIYYIPCGLKSVTITDGDILSCAFDNCTGLSDVTIGTCTYIGEYAFNNCKNLTSIWIPKTVKEIDYNAFRDCRRLSEIWFE